MKEAGFYTIDMGLESGDQETRYKLLKRFHTDEMLINCSKWFKKYGIEQLTYNIIGLPYEDIHKALKTIKLNAKMESDRMIPNIFYPYPGTELHDIAMEAGFVPDEISPDTRVPLVQEQFPEHEVLYIAAYFGHFVKRYKWAYKMPSWLGKPYEKWLDYRVTGKLVPKKFLVFVHDKYVWVRTKIKTFIIHKLPSVYMKMRKIKYRKTMAS